MKIQMAALSAATSDYAREMRARAALKQAQEARSGAVSDDAAKAQSSPRFEASESRKQQARAKLQQVREWLKILKKLYAQNPKAMAGALAQVFKELKAAVAAYKDAGGQEMGAAGEVVGGILTPHAVAPKEAEAGTPAEAEEDAEPSEDSDDDDAEADMEADGADDAQASSEGRSLYDAVVSAVRQAFGEDGLQFLKEVRGMVEEIGKLLETARGQAAARKRDKESDKAFEDADKALKALHDEMGGMEAEIRREAPTAGMRLSIAA